MSWQLDPAHSQITFSVRHMMISKVRGRFDSFSGSIGYDENAPSQTAVNIDIDAASVNTGNGDRDGHLQSPDFLNVGEFPTISFVGKRVDEKEGKKGVLVGDLTMAGVTKEVPVNVEFLGIQKNPFTGATSAGFTGNTTINRKAWGLEWNVALETGGWLVGEEINVEVEVELVKEA